MRGDSSNTITRKVFGIGLSRTGTMSLSHALNSVGLRSVHFPHDTQTQVEITEFVDAQPNFLRLSVLTAADAITDTPATIAFEELDRAYPESRFILTLRDEEEWLESCAEFWRTVIAPQREVIPRPSVSIYAGLINRTLYGGESFEDERFRRVKIEFEDRVMRYFRKRERDLLALDICGGQGWKEICSFLRVPLREESFPHVHKRDPAGRSRS
jgi:hypothetical protein